MRSHLTLGISLINFFIFGAAQKWMGPGKWQVARMMECADRSYPYKMGVATRKFNRTHDAVDAHIDLPDVVDDAVGVRIEVCKHVDGGCKPYRVVKYAVLEDGCKRWAPNNTEIILGMAGVDPPRFPIQPGKYELKNFLFNYDELPNTATYGNFDAKIFFTKHFVDVACFNVLYEFKPEDD